MWTSEVTNSLFIDLILTTTTLQRNFHLRLALVKHAT